MATLATLGTELCADAVAFCPSSRALLACGCYELLPGEPSRRVGRLTLLSTRGDRLDTLQQVGDDGVLDCAWAPPSAGRPQLLATASSTGRAHLLRLDPSAGTAADASAEASVDPTPRLEPCSECECVDAGVCMALDWGEGAAGASARLALSSTAGRLYVLDGAPTGLVPLLAWQALTLRPLRCCVEVRCVGELLLCCATAMWQAHDLEGWAVAFDRAEGANTLYSGADDGVLKRWDLRCDPAAAPAATATNRRSHRAGVCCISPSPSDATLVASGSYDEMVRLWDVRSLREPTHELACGGGVWRLRWRPLPRRTSPAPPTLGVPRRLSCAHRPQVAPAPPSAGTGRMHARRIQGAAFAR